MNKMQEKDANECAEMGEHGEDKDCMGCSFSVCIAQEPTDYKPGIRKAIEILEQSFVEDWNGKANLERAIDRLKEELSK